MLTVDDRQVGDVLIVSVMGKITFDTMHVLNAHLKEIYAERMPASLVLDLRDVRQMDSAGIGLLVACRNVMNRKMGQIYLCGMPASVKGLLSRMNLLNYFPTWDSELEADPPHPPSTRAAEATVPPTR